LDLKKGAAFVVVVVEGMVAVMMMTMTLMTIAVVTAHVVVFYAFLGAFIF